MTKVFFDTEFTGLNQAAKLISFGAVAETGETIYFEMNDYGHIENDWVRDNVILTGEVVYNKLQATQVLTAWLSQFETVQMWSDCLAYDWVLFCELFGGAMSIPTNVSYIPFDLCTLLEIKGIDPDINRETLCGLSSGAKHNALWDAQVIKKCYETIHYGVADVRDNAVH